MGLAIKLEGKVFHRARVRLTVLYLIIIVLVSLFFSVVIYFGVNRELMHIEAVQRVRDERYARVGIQIVDSEPISEVRRRILLTLGTLDAFILVASGISGYFLAGKTLYPIEEMLETQKNFVSNASHELRTPLTSLKTEIEVELRNKSLTLPGARALLKSNLEEVNKMQKLSNYLLNLNRYQKGENNLILEKVDLKDVVLMALKNVDLLAKRKHLKIAAELQPAKVKGEEDSLLELVTILLDNAIKYSKKNGKIIVKASETSLSIQDFGMGIAEEDLPHIFERFYRADVSRSKEKKDGYGLGLSIAQNIVEMYEAKIEVKSKVGKGTTFIVKFS